MDFTAIVYRLYRLEEHVSEADDDAGKHDTHHGHELDEDVERAADPLSSRTYGPHRLLHG